MKPKSIVLICLIGLVAPIACWAQPTTMTQPENPLMSVLVAPPPALQFSASTYIVAENSITATITVQRSGDAAGIVRVDYASTNLSATGGVDYSDISGTLIFAAGETNQSFTVPILNDGLIEGLETYLMILSNPAGGAVLGARTTATVRITDNDKGPAFEFANYWAREDEGSVLVGVVRGDDGNFPITVNVISSDGNAKAGLDYVGITNTLSFAAGEKLKLFTIPILNDGLKEADETFRVSLTSSTGVALGNPKIATITILDNDPGIQFRANRLWLHETEATVQLTVTRGNDVKLDKFTVDYATLNGTAIAGSDYTETKGTLAFAAGEMTKSIVVPILNDGVAERDKQFKVILNNSTGGMALGTAAAVTATVTVCDVTEMLPHRLDTVQASTQGMVSLNMKGGFTPSLGLSNRFQSAFDIYPLEASKDLVRWEPSGWFIRTNADTNWSGLTCFDTNSLDHRFYRSPTQSFISPQLPPTGSHAVGVVRRMLTDPIRRNRYRESGSCRFMITVWYPADRTAGEVPSALLDAQFARESPSPWWTFFEDRAPYFSSYSVQNAKFAAELLACPIVLWSHGYEDYHEDGLDIAEQLASHGYVVIGIGHHDETETVFSDGTYRYLDPNDVLGRDSDEAGLQDRVRDCQFVEGTLEGWNKDGGLFNGHLDTQNIAAAGWSWGGVTAGEYCRVEGRCRVAVGVDGGAPSWGLGLTTYGLQKPSLSMNNPSFDNSVLISRAKTNAVAFQISNTEHGDFGSWYWMYATRSTELQAKHEARRTVRDFTLWFLNKHLKGLSEPMPALKYYPRIINFKQK